MFGFFKKQEKPVEVEVVEDETPPKEYPLIVQQIHQEFETAGQRLLDEAMRIINSPIKTDNERKLQLLETVGFVKTQELIDANNERKILKEQLGLLELVQYYQLHYPNNKFITEDQIRIICNKYGLVFGLVSQYKGFVPANKLEQIASFKLNDADICFKREFYGIYMPSWNREESTSIDYSNCINKIKMDEINERKSRQYNSNYENDPYKMLASLSRLEHKEFYVRVNDKMMICAPLKDMDVTGYSVKGHKLVKDIPDPVVLQPVKGGYLILAAWGDEASDELVVNNKMN